MQGINHSTQGQLFIMDIFTLDSLFKKIHGLHGIHGNAFETAVNTVINHLHMQYIPPQDIE